MMGVFLFGPESKGQPMSFADLRPVRQALIPSPVSEMRVLAVCSFFALLLLGTAPLAELKESGDTIATQNGFEVALGRLSFTGLGWSGRDIKEVRFPPGSSTTGLFDSEPGITRSFHAVGFFLLIFSGLGIALFARPAQFAVSTALFCSLLAGSLLAYLLVTAFPIERQWTAPMRYLSNNRTVSYTVWSGIVLVLTFLLPAAVFVNWVREKRKRQEVF